VVPTLDMVRDWRENLPALRTIIFPQGVPRGIEKRIAAIKEAYPEVTVFYNGLKQEPVAKIVVPAAVIGNVLQAIWDFITWPFRG